MRMCGYEVQVVNSEASLRNATHSQSIHLVFIDPSITFNPMDAINDPYILSFYDCEDAPTDYNIGTVYKDIAQHIPYYTKMNWVGEKYDGKKLVGFPNVQLMQTIPVAQAEISEFTNFNAIPFFVGTGTFLGDYTPVDKYGRGYCSNDSVSSIVPYQDKVLYNQRIDWLLSMQEYNIPYVGGIVFKGDNLSKEWQSKAFGEGVQQLEHPGLDRTAFFNHLFNFRIGLNPTGHDRNSWRIFDLMAAGSIIYDTEQRGIQGLYMPKIKFTVRDGHSLGERITQDRLYMKEMWKESQVNREIIASLTPEKMRKDFEEQFDE